MPLIWRNESDEVGPNPNPNPNPNPSPSPSPNPNPNPSPNPIPKPHPDQALPQLPLQKSAGLGRFCFKCGNGNPPSDWFVARNLGDGIEFYGNAKTGQSQFELPREFK